MQFSADSNIKSSTIGSIGSLTNTFAVRQISLYSSLKSGLYLRNGLPLIGHQVINKQDAPLQASVFDAYLD